MIKQPAFIVEPWRLCETALDVNALDRTESLFALSNGHIGLRGNLDEGEPHGLPGSYLNGFYEERPMPYAEAGYGFPQSAQMLINVTNAKLIRLLVNDEPFDIRYGTLRAHRRVLDFRTGTLTRTAEWISPTGRAVRVTSTRLVSFTQRAVIAISYEVEPLENPIRVVLQSELVANEQLPARGGDPRAASIIEAPLSCEHYSSVEGVVVLVHRTKQSGLRMAAGMDHVVSGSPNVHVTSQAMADLGRASVVDFIHPGQRLRLTKFAAYGWSNERTIPAVRDQVVAALEAARVMGWEQLLADQREYLARFWERADVELDGDAELQQAVRFGLFHVLQAGSRAEGRAIAAKGLTGPGYDGHAFWDSEAFVLPALLHSMPAVAASSLRWRHSTLGAAKERATQLGLAGAAFPWRTINGKECSGYWPAGTAAFHVNASIADAAIRYVQATDDIEFERSVGLDLLVETARLWRSLGHYDLRGIFRIDGVTGPDEYSAIADNNTYTNLMAQRNLRAAVLACERHHDNAQARSVTTDELADWRGAADHVLIPYDSHLRVHEQSEGFTTHAVWNFAATAPDQYPLMLHFPYFDLYRKQVVKQPDLVLAMQLCSDAFTSEEKARNFEYYEGLTVRDSSLSACMQAVLAAETGHLRLALDYAAEAALIDLDDLEHNTRDGLHIASLAGIWTALVAGFGGMRDHAGTLAFAPRIPEGIARLAFTVVRRGLRLRVSVTDQEASYQLLDEDGVLELVHHGERIKLGGTEPVVRKIPASIPRPRPTQPLGREPKRR